MSFRAERKRLRDTLQPGEEILARDPLCTIDERPELTVLALPVLVVTDRSIYRPQQQRSQPSPRRPRRSNPTSG